MDIGLRETTIGTPALPMPDRFRIVAIAGSKGSLNALISLLSGLPVNFPVPIVVVRHLSPDYPSLLAGLLKRRISLDVKEAQDGDHLMPGTVYLAPPNRHLLVRPDGVLALSDTPKVNFTRPAADPLFESVARCYSHSAIAVVLTGGGIDGAAGVRAIKERGGTVIVQSRATSEAFRMPEAAILTGCVDFVLSLPVISSALISLIMVQGAAHIFGILPPAA